MSSAETDKANEVEEMKLINLRDWVEMRRSQGAHYRSVKALRQRERNIFKKQQDGWLTVKVCHHAIG